MRALLPVLAYAAFIFWLSSLPSTETGTMPHVDKVVHLAEYAVLGVLLVRAWMHLGFSGAGTVLVLTVASGALLAGLDETYQGLTGRNQSWADWVADVAGLLLASVFWPRLKRL